MAIHFVSVKCPECGAQLKIEDGRKKLFCSYCGAQILVDNDNEYTINENIRHIDEAEIRRAETDREVQLRRLDIEERKSSESASLGKIMIYIAIALCAIGIICIIIGLVADIFDMDSLGIALVGIAVFLFVKERGYEFTITKNTNDGYGTDGRKSKALALVLCVFLGVYGIHNFYTGKIGKGILYLFTFGLFFVGWIADIISIAQGRFTDNQGRPLV